MRASGPPCSEEKNGPSQRSECVRSSAQLRRLVVAKGSRLIKLATLRHLATTESTEFLVYLIEIRSPAHSACTASSPGPKRDRHSQYASGASVEGRVHRRNYVRQSRRSRKKKQGEHAAESPSLTMRSVSWWRRAPLGFGS